MALTRIGWANWIKGGWINLGEQFATLNLPANKVFSYVPRLALTTESSLISRGFNYFFDVAGGSTIPGHRVVLYGAVQIRDWSFARLGGKIAANWSRDEVRAFIFSLYPFGITTDSLDEGYGIYADYVFPTGSQVRAWADEALGELAQTVTPNAILIASYADKYLQGQQLFYSGTTPINPNNATNRNALGSQTLAKAGIDFYTKGISNIARANTTIYPGTGLTLVNGNRSNYIIAYNLLRLTKASPIGLPALSFTWMSLEQGGYTGDYAWRHELPNGTLWQNDEFFWSLNKSYNVTMASLIFGGGQIVWDRPDRFSTDNTMYNYQPVNGNGVNVHDNWYSPTNAAPPAPSAPYFPMRPQTVSDAHLSAAVDFGRMCQAGGSNYQFVRYRTNRGAGYGAWYEVPTDIPNAAILEAAQDFRGIAVAAVTGNDIALYFQDPSNPITGETVQIDLGSNRVVTFDCYGQEPVRIFGSLAANTTQTLLR